MSVRLRVAAAATLVTALVLAVASVLLVVRQRSGLTEQLDETLEREAERVAAVVEAGGDPGAADDDDDLLVIVEVDGDLVPVAGDRDLVRELPRRRLGGDGETHEVDLDGDRYRVFVEAIGRRDDRGRVIVAAALDDVDESVDELISSLVIVVPAAAVLLFGVVWFAVGRALRPVERIRREVDAIGLDQLDRRVPQPRGRDEIGRLARTMNTMLARLEHSARAQRQFVGDASHELKTPLTRIRTELEVDERHPDTADPAATRASVLEEVVGLQRLVDDLLVLARLDAASAPAGATPVDLAALVRTEISAMTTAEAGCAVDVAAADGCVVAGDADQIRRVVRNLLDNARRHARSRVAVAVGRSGPQVRLTVGDDGPGIPPDRRVDVFDRFTQLDDSRHTGGTGLGLAIVRDVVTRVGGTVSIGVSPLGGAEVVVELPAEE